MTNPARRLAHNAPGSFFVDATCIDCDTCRWMAPATFHRHEEQASVAHQPQGEGELLRARMALLSCPTGSIGEIEKDDLRAAQAALPDCIDGGVYHCGYHSEASFGAASYLIARAAGNVLVDSPRFTAPLARRLEELGGVRWLFLTHGDDVADHKAYRARFGCDRVIHERDLRHDTRDVEVVLRGDESAALTGDLLAIPVPGHTAGSTCLLAGGTYLFSGDHAAWSERHGHVYAFRDACWYDWSRQVESMRALAQHRFSWILPGHGRRCHFAEPEMARQMEQAIRWMESAAA